MRIVEINNNEVQYDPSFHKPLYILPQFQIQRAAGEIISGDANTLPSSTVLLSSMIDNDIVFRSPPCDGGHRYKKIVHKKREHKPNRTDGDDGAYYQQVNHQSKRNKNTKFKNRYFSSQNKY